MRIIAIVLLGVVLITFPFCARARTWYIKADGSGDAPTIQTGIDNAAVSDTVLVAAGTYTGIGNRYINFGGKDLVLKSEGGPEVTIIDCVGSGRGFYFYYSGESAAAVVEGFTITRASGPDVGGGMLCRGGPSPTVSNCTFSFNEALAGGGMAALFGSSPTVTNCTFYRNIGQWEAGGMYCGYSSYPIVTNCTFLYNSSSEGPGGGMNCYNSSPTVTNCTFSFNEALAGGGMFCSDNSSPTLQNTIIAFSTQAEAVYCDGSSSATLTCCDVYGNADGDWIGCIADQYGVNGNISEDPLFCGEADYPSDPYRLDIASPCAVRNSPCGELIGAQPVGCTGPVPAEPTTWGSVKAMYR